MVTTPKGISLGKLLRVKEMNFGKSVSRRLYKLSSLTSKFCRIAGLKIPI